MDNREILENLEDALENVKSAHTYLSEVSKADELLPYLEDIEAVLGDRISDLHKFIEAVEQADEYALEREYWEAVIGT